MTKWPARAYDPNRLRRAATRAVTRLGARRYCVEGRVYPSYDVDLDAETPCYCHDARYHGPGCLHELAARLHDGDSALILALGDMLLTAERAMREHRARHERCSTIGATGDERDTHRRSAR